MNTRAAPAHRYVCSTRSPARSTRILEASRALAEATPAGSFFEIPGRNHFDAPTSRAFRDAAIAFLVTTG